MTNSKIYRDLGQKLLYVFGLSAAGLFAWFNLSEFVTVGIQKNISGYPFGTESPAPWYYRSASTFSNFCLFFGILFSIVFITAIWAIIKGQKRVLLYSAILGLGLVLLQIFLSNAES
jgi:hypothetical protein